MDDIRNTIPSCALDDAGMAAQRERHRRLAPGVSELTREPEAVVVEFTAGFDRAALDEMVAVEQRCCPFFRFAFDDHARRLSVTVAEPEMLPALDAIHEALAAARA
jgi:hypothetical protein